jgi:biopolymer transport protein ExbB
MIPLFVLTVFVYFTALELLLRLQFHFLLRSQVYDWSDSELSKQVRERWKVLRGLLLVDATNAQEVRRHFGEVRNEYLSVINRRIKFLGVLVGLGPLLGLLGTVAGMLSTFGGMVSSQTSRIESVVSGISEALITTQTGLIISIPALVILSLIIQKRNLLQRAILRLERYNTCLTLRVGCPLPRFNDGDGAFSQPQGEGVGG